MRFARLPHLHHLPPSSLPSSSPSHPLLPHLVTFSLSFILVYSHLLLPPFLHSSLISLYYSFWSPFPPHSSPSSPLLPHLVIFSLVTHFGPSPLLSIPPLVCRCMNDGVCVDSKCRCASKFTGPFCATCPVTCHNEEYLTRSCSCGEMFVWGRGRGGATVYRY